MLFEIEWSIKFIILAMDVRKLIVVLISGVGTDKIFVIVCSVGNYQIVFIVCSIENDQIVTLISFLLHADRSNTSIFRHQCNV